MNLAPPSSAGHQQNQSIYLSVWSKEPNLRALAPCITAQMNIAKDTSHLLSTALPNEPLAESDDHCSQEPLSQGVTTESEGLCISKLFMIPACSSS